MRALIESYFHDGWLVESDIFGAADVVIYTATYAGDVVTFLPVGEGWICRCSCPALRDDMWEEIEGSERVTMGRPAVWGLTLSVGAADLDLGKLEALSIAWD